jgi:hypothetical protein
MQKQDQNINNLFTLFLTVPAIPAVLFAGFVGAEYGSGTGSDGFIAVMMVFFVHYLTGIVHTLILGIPAFLLGLRLDAISWWSCILVGFVIGLLPVTLLTQAPQVVFIPYRLCGAISGLGFWLLWRFWIRFDQQANTWTWY